MRPAVTADGIAVASIIRGGRVSASDRAAGTPGEVTLTAQQLLINQRIDQSAIRRAGALEDALAAGMASANIRPGALLPDDFDASVQTAGAYSGAIVPAGPGVTIPVPPAGDREGDPVRLTEQQMLINQRIAQAAVRRANALIEWLDDGPGRARHQGRRDRHCCACARHQHRLDLGASDAAALGQAQRRRGRRGRRRRREAGRRARW